jgi:hypothetical protein
MCNVEPHTRDSMPYSGHDFNAKVSLTIWVINEQLQPLGKLDGVTSRPRLVNQTDTKQIKEMHLVFSTKCRQFDLN